MGHILRYSRLHRPENNLFSICVVQTQTYIGNSCFCPWNSWTTSLPSNTHQHNYYIFLAQGYLWTFICHWHPGYPGWGGIDPIHIYFVPFLPFLNFASDQFDRGAMRVFPRRWRRKCHESRFHITRRWFHDVLFADLHFSNLYGNLRAPPQMPPSQEIRPY